MYHKWQPYDIWFLRYEPRKTEFFVILGHFLPLTSPKIKIFKKIIKKRNTWRNNHLTQAEPKIMIICYTVSEKWHMTDLTFIFHFCLFFALLSPCSLKNENFKKIKTHLEIHRFTQVYHKSWLYAILFLRHGAWLM